MDEICAFHDEIYQAHVNTLAQLERSWDGGAHKTKTRITVCYNVLACGWCRTRSVLGLRLSSINSTHSTACWLLRASLRKKWEKWHEKGVI
jgi:hypothetical protein